MGRDYRKLNVFHKAYALVLEIYGVLPKMPDMEQQNMTSQLQRAGTSIVLNIVEGCSHQSNKVFLNHLQYSYASCKEVDVILMLAYDLHYIDKELYSGLLRILEEVKASLYKFMQMIDRQIIKKTDNYCLA